MNVRKTTLLLTLSPLMAVLLLTGCESPPLARITSPDDILQLSPRLIFSTTNEIAKPPKAITVHNDGTEEMSVTGISITGTNATKFQLAPGQPTSFTVPGGGNAPVSVQFRPTTENPRQNTANLNLTTTAPGQETIVVLLRGLNARDFEGNAEPTPQNIFDVLGFNTVVGGTGAVPLISDPATHRFPIGDEVISPYWVRADTGQPAQLIPVARYIQRCPPDTSMVRWVNKNTGGLSPLYNFPAPPFDETLQTCDEYKAADPFGGENQRLMPGFTGNTNFSPTVPFGFNIGGSFSDDGRNNGGVVADCPPPREHPQSHNFRFYPAKVGGTQIPNTWLVILDVKFIPQPDVDCPDYVKNYDYQDIVFLLRNAQPELPTAPQGASLDFGAAVPGTVADKDGEGTGFTSVQPNRTDDALPPHVPANLDLDTAAGRLDITSTVGTNTNLLNNQQNAVQTSFDATRAEFVIRTQLLGPFSDINQGNEQEALFFGPDQNNYFKVEVENFLSQPVLSAVVENAGALAFVPGGQQVSVPGLATASRVELTIRGNYGRGTLQAFYSIDGGETVPLGDPVVPRAIASPCGTCLGVSRWFTTEAKAGVLVSDRNGTQLVGSYDSFTIGSK